MNGRILTALRALALSVLLVLWGTRLDSMLDLPAYGSPVIGWPVAAVGIVVMVAAAFRLGFVYRVASHPAFIGAFITAVGVALAMHSGASLWVVTPVLTLAMSAWALSVPRPVDVPAPFLSLPPDEDSPARIGERFAFVLVVLAPWLTAFMAVELLGAGPDVYSTFMAWDAALPVIPWTEAIYFSTYVLSTLAPFVVRTRRELRTLALDGIWASLIIMPLYLILPLVAQAKPVTGDGFWEAMLRFERDGDAPATAFPSFHIVWACIAARTWAQRFPALRWPLAILVVATGAACVTTGMHSANDILAGFAAYVVVIKRDVIWNGLVAAVGASRPRLMQSIAWTAVSGALVWRLWSVQAPVTFIVGAGFILLATGWFVLGSRKTLAAGMFIAGVAITAYNSGHIFAP